MCVSPSELRTVPPSGGSPLRLRRSKAAKRRRSLRIGRVKDEIDFRTDLLTSPWPIPAGGAVDTAETGRATA